MLFFKGSHPFPWNTHSVTWCWLTLGVKSCDSWRDGATSPKLQKETGASDQALELCICSEASDLLISFHRQGLWLSCVPRWWSVQALYLCTWLLQHKVTKRSQPEHLLQAQVAVGLYLELGHVASPSPWGIACAQQLPRETSCLGRWQLRSH